MGELKGGVLMTLFFTAVVIPIILAFSIDSLQQHSFMKVTTEVSDLVKEEAGVSDRVKDTVSRLNDKGYTISFTNQNGQFVNNKVNYGDTVIINYEYIYESVRSQKTLKTVNQVFVMTR